MTEQEWLACTDPTPMLRFLGEQACHRKGKLFCVACCWRVRRLLSDYSLNILRAVERLADTEPTPGEITSLSDDAMAYADGLSYRMGTPEGCAHWLAASAVWDATVSNSGETSLEAARAVECIQVDPAEFDITAPSPPSNGDLAERRVQAGLVRCIFGPSAFRPITLAPAWLTPTVIALATGIYAEKAFDRLPMLGDALEDAGCADAGILNHLREAGVHVKGCWPLDLLLGKG